ncbi:MAG: division/cell wall cluster transcriptional repressor MraZ [Dermatophilaceae bacterium]
MFLGEYFPRLDEKGRLILPAKFREKLADGLVITKGQEHCLYVFRAEQFSDVAVKLQSGPTSSKAVRDFARVMLSGASEEELDRQGRVTIPPSLRAYAGLDRDVAVVGMSQRIEIWDAAKWTGYLEDAEPRYASTLEEVYPGMF